MNKFHKTALINNNAKIGKNVTIGPYSIIDDNVIIGDNSVVYPYVHIKSNTIIEVIILVIDAGNIFLSASFSNNISPE